LSSRTQSSHPNKARQHSIQDEVKFYGVVSLLCESGVHVESSSRVLTLQKHNTENSKHVVTGKELRGFSPNSYIHDSVSDLYIPLVGLPILLQENRCAEGGNL
jgi:hypothetical protein